MTFGKSEMRLSGTLFGIGTEVLKMYLSKYQLEVEIACKKVSVELYTDQFGLFGGILQVF